MNKIDHYTGILEAGCYTAAPCAHVLSCPQGHGSYQLMAVREEAGARHVSANTRTRPIGARRFLRGIDG